MSLIRERERERERESERERETDVKNSKYHEDKLTSFIL